MLKNENKKPKSLTKISYLTLIYFIKSKQVFLYSVLLSLNLISDIYWIWLHISLVLKLHNLNFYSFE